MNSILIMIIKRAPLKENEGKKREREREKRLQEKLLLSSISFETNKQTNKHRSLNLHFCNI